MNKCQAVTTTVKRYFEPKIQNVKDFYQIKNEFQLILHVSINQIWSIALSCNVMFSLTVKDTTNETETFLQNVKRNAYLIFDIFV